MGNLASVLIRFFNYSNIQKMLPEIFGFICGILLVVFYKKSMKNFDVANKILGPPLYFMFGNLFVLIKSAKTNATFFKFLRECARKYKTAFHLWSLGILHVNGIRASEAEILLSSSKHNKKSEIYKFLHKFLGTGLLTSNGSKWQQRRKILTPTFHFNILQNFMHVFNEESVKTVSDLNREIDRGNKIVDACVLTCKFTLNTICQTAMGINIDKMEGVDEYRNNLFGLIETFVYRIIRPWLYSDFMYWLLGYQSFVNNKYLRPIHSFTRRVIDKRRAMFYENRDSFEDLQNENIYETKKRRYAMLDTLLANEVKGMIDAEGIQEEVDTFMFEGHDTTSSGLTFILLLLAIHEDVQERVYEELAEALEENNGMPLSITKYGELHYLDRVIKESLRLYPPVSFMSRESTEEIKLPNVSIPKGTMLHLHIYDLHRDPNYFPDPEKFDPDRFLPENCINRHPFAYIPFSAGPRNCIGQKFAMLEMKVFILYILTNFKMKAITKREDVAFIVDIVLRTNHPIEIQFDKRKEQGNDNLDERFPRYY